MKYTTLPHSDVRVSKICLGTMTWGNQNTQAEGFVSQIDAAAAHVKGLSGNMVSATQFTLACTAGAHQTASAVAKKFKTVPQVSARRVCMH